MLTIALITVILLGFALWMDYHGLFADGVLITATVVVILVLWVPLESIP